MKKKKLKKDNKPDKKYTSLESIKFKGNIFDIGSRYRTNKVIGKMKLEQLVELIQIVSETTCKIQSIFDHSTYVVSFSDLSDI